MKKSHAHNEMSSSTCMKFGCRKMIKQRLIETKLHVPLCYKCYCEYEAEQRGHFINSNPRKRRIDEGLPVKNFK